MISLKQVNKIMLKIFSVMEKLNRFSNQMAGSGLSSDHSKEETKRKGRHEKHLDKLEQKKKRLQREIDNIKKKRKKTAAEPEILGGFDCKRIGNRMMNELQRPHKDETKEANDK